MHHKIHTIHKHTTAIGGFLLFISCFVLVGMSGGFSPKTETSLHAAGCTIDNLLVNSCRPWLGATVGGYGMTGSDPVSQFNFANKRLNDPSVLSNPSKTVTLNKHLDIIHTYHSPTQTNFLPAETNFMTQPNTYLLINWKPDLVWAAGGGGNATVNSRIDAMADLFKTKPSNKFFFALFHEPEDDVSAGNCATPTAGASAGSPTEYRNMWHNVRARFNAKGVNNVVWVMNYMGFSNWNCLVPLLYPGDSYVDWIMWDPYADGTGTNASFGNSINNMYNYLTNNSNSSHNYLSKPWGLSEHGVRLKNGTTQSVAINYWNLGATAINNNTYPKLKAYVVFDTTINGTSRVGYDFDGAISIEEQTAFNNFGNAIFAKDIVDPPPPPSDTTKPTVSFSSPVEGATVSGTITIGVDAADNVAVTKVDIFWDSVNIIRSATSQGTYGWGSRWDSRNASDGVHTLSVIAYDGAGNSRSAQRSITVRNAGAPPAPSIGSFTANPALLTVGNKSTLSWATTNVTTCSVSPGGPQDSTDTSWQTLTFTSSGTTTYTLTCKNSAGATASATTSVTVTAPTSPPSNVTLNPSTTTVEYGGSVHFEWTSSGSTSCVLNPGNYSASGTASSKTISNITATTTYKLTCSNSAGSTDSADKVITVSATPAAPVINSFIATPSNVASGSTSTLTWSATDVATNGCSLAVSPLSSTNASGQWTTGALTSSTSYTLTCSNSAGSIVSASVYVTVNNIPPPVAPPPVPPASNDNTDDDIVSSTTGDQVINTQHQDSVYAGDLATLDVSTVLDEAKIDNIEKVEFYLDDMLIQTVMSAPFALDTTMIAEGTYNITQRTYYKDGSFSEEAQVVTIMDAEDTEVAGDTSKRSRTTLVASLGTAALIVAVLGVTGGSLLKRRGFTLPFTIPWHMAAHLPAAQHIDPDIKPIKITRAAPLAPGTIIHPQTPGEGAHTPKK